MLLLLPPPPPPLLLFLPLTACFWQCCRGTLVPPVHSDVRLAVVAIRPSARFRLVTARRHMRAARRAIARLMQKRKRNQLQAKSDGPPTHLLCSAI